MREVLFVSKPVEPPWNDSSKNLVRDVAGHLQRHHPRVMVRQGRSNPLETGREEQVYSDSSLRTFSLGWREQLAVFQRLILGDRVDLWHFFFAPNRRSCVASKLAGSVRGVPTVHTVCSAPHLDASLRQLLFADVTVVLSKSTHRRLRAEYDPSSIRLIPPCVPKMAAFTRERSIGLRRAHGFATDAPVLIYPGDVELGAGARIALESLAAWSNRDATLIMACRHKTPAATVELQNLKRQARLWGIESRVRWIGETPNILDLLALADFVLMVTDSSYAKMDYPLVALEAMSLGSPVLVGSETPAAELAEEGAARSVAADGQAIAVCLDALCSDTATVSRMLDRARALVTTRFAPETVAAQYEIIYDEVCG